MSKGIVAVMPMKPLSQTKSRLADCIPALHREALSLNLLSRGIRAAVSAPIEEVMVIGGDSRVSLASRQLGAIWRKSSGFGLNADLTLIFREIWRRGHTALYLPGDLPFVSLTDLKKVIAASKDGERLVLSPSERDGGTNCMVVPPSLSFKPALGNCSFKRHMRNARKIGIDSVVCYAPGLGRDLDTVDDLVATELLEPGFFSRMTFLG